MGEEGGAESLAIQHRDGEKRGVEHRDIVESISETDDSPAAGARDLGLAARRPLPRKGRDFDPERFALSPHASIGIRRQKLHGKSPLKLLNPLRERGEQDAVRRDGSIVI